MAETRVTRQDSGGLATLTLNRPDKLNALDTAAFAALDAHLVTLANEADHIGCVVLKGNGKGFCAGADLKAIGSAPIDPRFKPRVVERLGALPQPVIAAVHGVCYTGGLELALACDFILADSTARFADTHGTWGLVGAWGMGQRLPRRIGTAAAKRMMMTARPVAAEEALAMGLIDTLAGEGDLETAVAALVEGILANSWHTNFTVKRMMRETDGMTLAQGLAHEHLRHPGFAPDHRERMGRFNKR